MKPSKEQFDDARELHLGRVEAYRRGELNDNEFRAIRLSYGLYYQLDHTSYMQRIKLPGGIMTSEQMEALAAVTDDFGRGITHVTTRQDVQIHWVPLDKVGELYQRLEAVGITTRGACADSIRNVTACPFAGVDPDEAFDISPYVLALHDYFLFNPLNLTLPRKFKIAVEGCPVDCAEAMINDIGLYAKLEGGVPGFSVWAGGGLGPAPHLAVEVYDFVPGEDVLIVCEAIVRLQHRAGERKNRHKARMKFLVKKLGAANFVAAVKAETPKVARERGDALRGDVQDAVAAWRPLPPVKRGAQLESEISGGAGFKEWRRTNARPQKDAGYSAATVTLPLGDINTDQLRAIARLARELGDGSARATVEQNIVLPWIRNQDLPLLHRELVGIGLAEGGALLITDVVSCPGLDYCSLAVTRSMGVGDRIRGYLAESGLDAESLGPFHVKISGCPNSCGQHHVGDIGLTGMMVKDDDGVERPHYSFLVGGGVGEGRSRIGKRLFGRYPEAEAPRAIVALAEYYRVNREAGERFAEFVERVGNDVLDGIAQQAISGPVR